MNGKRECTVWPCGNSDSKKSINVKLHIVVTTFLENFEPQWALDKKSGDCSSYYDSFSGDHKCL